MTDYLLVRVGTEISVTEVQAMYFRIQDKLVTGKFKCNIQEESEKNEKLADK